MVSDKSVSPRHLNLMSTLLYSAPIFGPVKSRRLGLSLGINLLPADGKLCNFDCLYCECGLNREKRPKSKMPTRQEVAAGLEATLKRMHEENEHPDTLTFAGNGEPTLHPDFAGIIEDTLALRDRYAPKANISVLTNATRLLKPDVFNALMKVDNPLLKLDTIDTDYIRLVDRPTGHYDLPALLDKMKAMGSHAIIQTMFLKGEVNGINVDNTSDAFVTPWLEIVKAIGPKLVTIYTIDRETPEKGLQKAGKAELNRIADRLRKAGFKATVSY